MVYMHCHCFKYLGKKCYWKWGWRELRQIYCIGSDDLVKKKGNLYSSQGQPCWRSLITWSLPLLAIIALHSLFLPRSTLMPPSIHDTLLLPTGTWGWFDRAGEWFPSFLSHSPHPLSRSPPLEPPKSRRNEETPSWTNHPEIPQPPIPHPQSIAAPCSGPAELTRSQGHALAGEQKVQAQSRWDTNALPFRASAGLFYLKNWNRIFKGVSLLLSVFNWTDGTDLWQRVLSHCK